jgi:hypothetical protein
MNKIAMPPTSDEKSAMPHTSDAVCGKLVQLQALQVQYLKNSTPELVDRVESEELQNMIGLWMQHLEKGDWHVKCSRIWVNLCGQSAWARWPMLE